MVIAHLLDIAHCSLLILVLRTSSSCLLANGFSNFSFPFRGAFHLSLAVLVHYRSERMFRLITLDVTDSHRVSCPVILGIPRDLFGILDTGLSPSLVPDSTGFSYPQQMSYYGPATPQLALRFSLFPVRSPLLRKSLLFYFPPLT